MRESSALRDDRPIVVFPSSEEWSRTLRSQTANTDDDVAPAVKNEVTIAVLSVSAGMVGVCLTAIGILKLLVIDRFPFAQWADELLAFTSLVFLFACIVSFRVVKSPIGPRRIRLHAVADTLFLIGLAIMVVVCLLITCSVATLLPG